MNDLSKIFLYLAYFFISFPERPPFYYLLLNLEIVKMKTNPRNLIKGLILFALITAAAISCQKGVDVNLNNISGQGPNSTDTTPAKFSLLTSQGNCSITKLNGKYVKGHA